MPPITLHTDVKDIPEQTELAQGTHRDEFQLKIDKDIEALKRNTAKAGWPVEFDPKKLYQRYVVGADDKAGLKAVIRRSMVLHRVEPVWYKDGKTEGGHASVKFHLIRKAGKDGKPVADDTLNEDGTMKPAASAAAS